MILLEAEGVGDGSGPSREVEVDLESDESPERMLCCAACGQGVTRERLRVRVQGQHEHTQMNPHGLFFRIGCFKDAEGARAETAPTTHWTWFTGYAWQIAGCRGCAVHLGWRFSGEDGSFWGLLVERLR